MKGVYQTLLVLLVVHKDLKQFCNAFFSTRGNFQIGAGCRHKTTVALLQVDGIANDALATHTYVNDKGVVVLQVARNLCIQTLHSDGKELAFTYEIGLVQLHWITDGILLVYSIVKDIGSKFCVQFTRLAIHTHTAIVVDTICYIAALLYLGYQCATTNGMNTTCRNEECIKTELKKAARLSKGLRRAISDEEAKALAQEMLAAAEKAGV